MPNYQNSKIYKLVSNKTSDIYIGSCLMRLSTRLSNHKNLSNTCASKKLFTNDAIITIVLVESFPCTTKNELKARELHYITTNNCINVNKPFVCEIPYSDIKAYKKEYNKVYEEANREQIRSKAKEYYAINTEQIKSKSKEYNSINAEHYSDYQKKYREANKENISVKKKEFYKANKENISAKSKEYHEANKEHLNEKQKEYYIIHRDQINTRRRALFAEKKLSQNVEHNLNNSIIV